MKRQNTRGKLSIISSEFVQCFLSYLVVILGIGGVVALALLMLCLPDKEGRGDMGKLLLSSVLPVIGTWVGTVLAYYFAKENFESAARATERLAGIEERLRAVPVTTAMIPIAKADKWQLNPGQDPESLNLKELITRMTKAKRNRLPVLDDKGAGVYVIHLSTLTDFVAQKSFDGTDPKAMEKLTIADFAKNARTDLRDKIRAWASVPRGDTLADTKTAMERLSDCSDVFVTESGRKDEPVIGWVTNAEIALHSRA
jgi:hypothetical protein